MSWFDAAWPWIGLPAAGVLLALLFPTDVLRGDRAVPRWRDPVWLGWLVAPVYMIHQAEEYGINLLGVTRAFPAELCGLLGYGSGACPLPGSFFTAVNVTLSWVAIPLAALVARRLPLVGLGFTGLLLANGLTHVVGSLLSGTYGSGTLTAVLLFLPLAGWTIRTLFFRGRFGLADLAVVIGCGVLIQGILMASVLLFTSGRIGETTFVLIQVANAFVTPAVTAAWSLAAIRRRGLSPPPARPPAGARL